VVFGGVDEPPLRGVDAGCSHSRPWLIRINATVAVIMTVVVLVARQDSIRIFPAAAIKRRRLENLDKLLGMIHMNIVWVILGKRDSKHFILSCSP
jgi:hypothetical protein